MLFRKDEKGSVLVEAALIMPVLISLLLLGFETARYILVQQKLSRATATINDLLARVSDPETQINDIINATGHILSPFTLGNHSVVVTSLIYKETGQPASIVWQARGAGTSNRASEIGVQDGTPTFPSNFTIADEEVIMATEFFYHYESFFNYGFWSSRDLYFNAFNRPRLTDLDLLTN